MKGIQKKQRANRNPKANCELPPSRVNQNVQEISHNLNEMYTGFLNKEEHKQKTEIKQIEETLKKVTNSLCQELDMLSEQKKIKRSELEKLTFLYMWMNLIVEDFGNPAGRLKMPVDTSLAKLREILELR